MKIKRLSAHRCAKMLIAVVSVLTLLLAGCSSPDVSENPENERLKVVTSVYPIYDFALKIGGDKADVSCLMKPGTEPHDWEPMAQDITALEQADVFVYNGAGLEHWVDGVLSSLENEDLWVLNTSAQLELLDMEEGEEHDGHSHEEDSADPHLWLSPTNAKQQMTSICFAFGESDPENAAYYLSNLDKYSRLLDNLDEEYRSALEKTSSKYIVVAHKAYGYLCRDYGLVQVSARGFSPDQEPDPAQMARTVDFCRENNVKVIFFENPADPSIANAIASETGATTNVLNPIEALNNEQIEAGEDYFSIMRQNLKALEQALA